MSRLTVGLAFVLSLMACYWCLQQWRQAKQIAQENQIRLTRCNKLIVEISFLKERNKGYSLVKGGFQPASFARALTDTGLEVVSIVPNPGQKIAKTSVREWFVEIPSSKLTIAQVVDLIQNLATTDANYQISSLTLTKSDSTDPTIELWLADFAIRFLALDETEH